MAKCKICGRHVAWEDDSVAQAAEGGLANSLDVFFKKTSHINPVFENGVMVCPGDALAAVALLKAKPDESTLQFDD